MVILDNNLIGKLALKFIILLSILLLLLVIVNFIPKAWIEDNVKESVSTFLEEGFFPQVKFAYKFLLDNYTDALMINTAYSIDTDKTFISTMLMRRGYRNDENLNLLQGGQDDDENPIKDLQEAVDETNTDYYEYSRYWQGYMIYLRPLLIFFN